MIKSIKVRLEPNNKQKTKLFQFANAARFAYNWAIAREQENYSNVGKFLSDCELRREFTQLKKQDNYQWLYNISNDVTKQAIKDACDSYKRFFKGQCKYPKFKSRKFSRPSFYQDTVKVQFTDSHVKLEHISNSRKQNRKKLNWIRLSEKGRIPYETGIGIDLGLKDLAICSDGVTYKSINKTNKVKKLEKKKRRLQRKVSNKYELNKKGKVYCKTNNIKKLEKQLLKLNHQLTNIRQNYLHQTTTNIIKRKPSFIVLEDLNVSGMMKNKHLSKAIQQQLFYEFKKQIEYKCNWNNIELIIADRFFPSSKLCSCCGNIKKDLKLSDRIYKCECGNIIDRDYQASLNLMKYGERLLQEQSVA